jgi:outer membrane protein OmpA-like peptidoglycan-associated protein
MSARRTIALFSSALLIAGGLSACATPDYVRRQVAAEDLKLQATQGQVAANQTTLSDHEARMAGLDRTSREALDRAQAAGKLAEGKFLYAMVLSDDSVKFPPDSSELSPEARTRLLDLVQKLKSENKNVYLEIQGHTDAAGSKSVNMRLGQDRAEAVRLFMNRQGVALNRMATISYGGDAPVASNKTRSGRAQNRRVVIVVLA